MNTKNQYNNIIAYQNRQERLAESFGLASQPSMCEVRSLTSQISFSVNRSGKNKDWDYRKLTNDFENVTGTIKDVLAAVKAGNAINGAHFKGTRSKANVTGVQLLLVDIDNTSYRLGDDGKAVKDAEGKKIPVYSKELTIEDALLHPFVKRYCSLIYTTASHRPDHHKLRLSFVLPEQIDRETYESLAEIVLKEFPHDPACKDAGRVFYGNTNAEIILYNPDAVLDSSFIETAKVKKEQDAIARQEREQEQKRRREENKRRWEASGRTDQDLEELVKDALSHIPPRQKGSGNYDDCLKVLTALRNEFGHSKGTAIAEEWSPPSVKDNWFPSRKKTNNPNILIGSIFYLAQHEGWRFPVGYNQDQIINPKAYECKSSLSRILRTLGNKIKLTKKRLDAYGFGKKQVEKRARIRCQPQTYKKHQRLDTWQGNNNKFVVDSSETGSGKSFDAGRVKPDNFGVKKVIIITADPRNVTTSSLRENWAVNQGRHDGLTVDHLGKTRRAKADDPIVISGNCMRTETIAALSRKNVDGSNSSELICGGCPQYGLCKSGIRYGDLPTGYLGDRQKVLANSRIITHPRSLPMAESFSDYEETLLIWDEWTTLFSNSKQVKVWESDLKEIILRLAKNAPELISNLLPLFTELGKIFEEKAPSRFGWNHAELVERLKPILPKNLDIDSIAMATEPNLDALNPTKEYGCDIQDMPKEVKKIMVDPDSKTAHAIEEKTIKQWILPFLNILLGEPGYLNKSGGILTITTPDSRLVDIARKAKRNIFMDATGYLPDLAALLGISIEEIDHIATEQSDKGAKVQIIQVAGLGRLGQQRGGQQERQTAAITKTLREKHPGIRKIAFKRFAEDNDLRWYVESRGSNDAEKDPALILEGVPTPNLNALAAEFACIYKRVPEPGTTKVQYRIELTNAGLPGEGTPYLEINESADPQFREFIRRRVLAAIKQGFGRLRANRREGEELTIYFLGDYPLDVPVELVKASNITPEAASKSEQFETALKEAIAQLHSEGKKITQSAVAKITGYSQGYISRFRKLLLLLIESFSSKSNNLAPPDPDTEWTAREQLPLATKEQLIEEVLNFREVLGDRQTVLLFDLMSPRLKQDLVYWLLATQPDSVLSEFREVVS